MLIGQIIEILILFIIFYAIFLSLKGTRGAGILKGLIFIFVVVFLLFTTLARVLELSILHYILREWFMVLVLITLIILFQPELRRAFFKLGQSRLFNPFFRVHARLIDEIIKGVFSLAEKRWGALIAIEREVGLKPYIEGGVRLDAEVTSELLETIFHPGTALHDGGVIIREDRLVAAGCLFPLTDNPDIAKTMGTRHRAGIGLTEESDTIVIIISEETGRVSVGLKGNLTPAVTKDTLRNILEGIYLKGEKALSPEAERPTEIK